MTLEGGHRLPRRRAIRTLLAPLMTTLLAPFFLACTRKDTMDITAALERACATLKPGDTLAFESVAPFAWDHLLLAGPYTPVSELQRVLQGPLPSSLKDIDIDRRDDVNAAVFLNGNDVVHAQALARRVIDFDKAFLLKPIPRAQARFVRTPNGVLFVLASG